MNENIDSNQPKKRLKQTSIVDFITIGTKRDDIKGNMSSDNDRTNSPLASTSEIKTDCNGSEDNNDLMVGTDDQSIEAIDRSESSYLSEIPETPENQLLSDEEMDSEDESMDDLNRLPNCLPPMTDLRPDLQHLVLFRLPFDSTTTSPPKPFPNSYLDKWDAKHVKMPNSGQHMITSVEIIDGQEVRKRIPKWELICENLLSDIKSSHLLEEAIKTYNPFISKNFRVLHQLFNEDIESEERIQFFDNILPEMVKLALRLPQIVTQSVPMLRQRQNSTLFLSQQQIASLLANAFFCTFPKRSHSNEEYNNYPVINFSNLFSSSGGYEDLKTKVQKLKCIVNYFRRVIKDMPKGVISFERKCLAFKELPDWQSSYKEIRKLVVLKNGFIECEGKGLLQVDFANKYIGGGVLGSGCVQEEIRFVINPELLVSLLFTERLLDNECLIICGSEQFNTYSGYANTFQWNGDYTDDIPYDHWGRRLTRIVAIDALYFNYNETYSQYQRKQFLRELNKAFTGFVDRTCDPKHSCAIASGNWGCGAFNGDPLLKAIIQLMAASQADRDLVLFTFKDKVLENRFKKFYSFLVKNHFCVKHLFKGLVLYEMRRKSLNVSSNVDIFQFIESSVDFIFENSCH